MAFAATSRFQRVRRRISLYKTYAENDSAVNRSKLQLSFPELDKLSCSFDSCYEELEIALHNLQERSNEQTELLNSLGDIYDEVHDNIVNIRIKYAEWFPNPVILADNNKSNPALSDTHEHNDNKLPPLQLPTFTGDKLSYMSFHDLFHSLVVERTDLSGIQKFRYLKGCLQGEPADLIKNIPVTTNNFESAWNMLHAEYFRPRTLRTLHFRELISLPVIKTTSADSLKMIVHSTRQTLAALNNLDVKLNDPHALGYFLESMIADKLDVNTRRRWESTLKTNSTPSHEDLLDFLAQQIICLESSITEKPTLKSIPKLKERPISLLTKETSCILCKQSHRLFVCDRFIKLSPKHRFDVAKRNNYCINCLSPEHRTKCCSSKNRCKYCNGQHHSMLHFNDRFDKTQFAPATTNREVEQSSSDSQLPVTNTSLNKNSTVLLATAIVKLKDKSGTYQEVRVLFDSGSQLSYLSERCARNMGLSIEPSKTKIQSLGGTPINVGIGITQCSIQPAFMTRNINSSTLYVRTVVVKTITNLVTRLDKQVYPHLENLTLADPGFQNPQNIDMLLGAEVVSRTFLPGCKRGPRGTPTAFNTIFGWVLMGEVQTLSQVSLPQTLHLISDENLNDLLTKFWTIENISSTPPVRTIEDQLVETNYKETIKRYDSGRYEISLPFKKFPPDIGPSFNIALKCYHSLINRLNKDTFLKKEYIQFISELIANDYIEPIDQPNDQYSSHFYYMPHHPVVKLSSTTTAVRVVINASKITANGQSLNDNLFPGPVLQRNIMRIHLTIRLHPILIIADVAKMFLQIKVNPEHRSYLRILWNESLSEQPQIYQFSSLPFGLNCAPFLAIRTIEQLAEDEQYNFPLAAKVLLEQTYVDDVVTGANNLESAKELCTQLIGIFKAGGFCLRKWSSSSMDLLHELPSELISNLDVHLDDSQHIKLLGVKWVPSIDQLSYNVNNFDNICTKRNVLSCLAKIYDPLGLLAPITMMLKIMVQKFWVLKLDWDETPPSCLIAQWTQFLNELHQVVSITFPRRVIIDSNPVLIGFSDASEKGYCAVVYVKNISHNSVHLLCAKTRVAPLKRQTIPRLELCAAHVLANLMRFIKKSIPDTFQNTYVFTDSEIVLSWLTKEPCRLKTFVGNRVAQIQEILPGIQWNYVSTQDNPADPCSRGLTPIELTNHPNWLYGPPWLSSPTEEWPTCMESDTNQDTISVVASEEANTFLLTSQKEYDLTSKSSSYIRLWHAIVYCLRWRHRERRNKEISIEELLEAHIRLLKWVQSVEFTEELRSVGKGTYHKGQLVKLNPFIDDDGLLRVGGRLSKSKLDYDHKHPILLPPHHKFTHLLIEYYHKKWKHVGVQTLESIIGRKFWIINARRIIRTVVTKCVSCFKLSPTSDAPYMGDLPVDRVTAAKPFAKSGVDFGGPFNVTFSRRRGQKIMKAYICLFICFSTKSVHLELVSSLSTETFLAALSRFIARRGRVTDIHSDCGTNFVGTARHLTEVQNLLKDKSFRTKLQEHLVPQQIQWHFNPPSAPHFGGLWEAAIKSAKRLLRNVLGQRILTYEEFLTVLTEVEAILNSRPLHPRSNDPSDLQPLTPGHFLTMEPLVGLPSYDYIEIPTNHLTHWELVQQLHQQFWKRWHQIYLRTLQQRQKWSKPGESLKPNMLVLVHDQPENLLQWKLGRILETIPGKDNIVRVLRIKTSAGIITRPVVKVSPLPNQNI